MTLAARTGCRPPPKSSVTEASGVARQAGEGAIGDDFHAQAARCRCQRIDQAGHAGGDVEQLVCALEQAVLGPVEHSVGIGPRRPETIARTVRQIGDLLGIKQLREPRPEIRGKPSHISGLFVAPSAAHSAGAATRCRRTAIIVGEGTAPARLADLGQRPGPAAQMRQPGILTLLGSGVEVQLPQQPDKEMMVVAPTARRVRPSGPARGEAYGYALRAGRTLRTDECACRRPWQAARPHRGRQCRHRRSQRPFPPGPARSPSHPAGANFASMTWLGKP